MFVVSNNAKSLSPFRKIYDAGLSECRKKISIYRSSTDRTNKSFSWVTNTLLYYTLLYYLIAVYVRAIYFNAMNYTLRICYNCSRSRSYISLIASRNLACVILSPNVSSRILQSCVYLQHYMGSTPIKLDMLFYRLTMNENNGRIHRIDAILWTSIFQYSDVPIYFASRFYFRKSHFLHLEVIWRSVHSASILWHWI